MYYNNNTSGRRFLEDQPQSSRGPPPGPSGLAQFGQLGQIPRPYLNLPTYGAIHRPHHIQQRLVGTRFQPYVNVPPFRPTLPVYHPQPFKRNFPLPLITPQAGMLADQVPVTSDVRPDDFKRFASYENFDSKGHIKIEEIVSSTQCVLRWITVTNIPISQYYYKYTLYQANKKDNFVKMEEKILESSRTEVLIPTIPGNKYRFHLFLWKRNEDKSFMDQIRELKAVFNLREINQLYEMSKTHFGIHPPQMFTEMYRCKPTSYFDRVRAKGNLMEKYIKDDNGHRASPINGSLRGLFFSAERVDNRLPLASPFGNERFIIAAEKIFTPGFYNLYFSDFYCNKKVHYATVVICRKGSPTDDFCKRWTKPLNIYDNPFLKVVVKSEGAPGPDYMFFVNNRLHVEICYTEDIPLSWGRMDRVDIIGIGTSRIGGLPNNAACKKCNIIAQKNVANIDPRETLKEELDKYAEADTTAEIKEEGQEEEEDVEDDRDFSTQVPTATGYEFLPSTNDEAGHKLALEIERELMRRSNPESKEPGDMFSFLPNNSNLRGLFAKVEEQPDQEAGREVTMAIASTLFDIVEEVGQHYDRLKVFEIFDDFIQENEVENVEHLELLNDLESTVMSHHTRKRFLDDPFFNELCKEMTEKRREELIRLEKLEADEVERIHAKRRRLQMEDEAERIRLLEEEELARRERERPMDPVEFTSNVFAETVVNQESIEPHIIEDKKATNKNSVLVFAGEGEYEAIQAEEKEMDQDNDVQIEEVPQFPQLSSSVFSNSFIDQELMFTEVQDQPAVVNQDKLVLLENVEPELQDNVNEEVGEHVSGRQQDHGESTVVEEEQLERVQYFTSNLFSSSYISEDPIVPVVEEEPAEVSQEKLILMENVENEGQELYVDVQEVQQDETGSHSFEEQQE